ncbi:MAG TPA: alpha/beta fold hydrolase [Thermoanaerobaculia bacterium]|nr:alpha/beta fold hydrolase [Thermoanaerobaculia bacterium]
MNHRLLVRPLLVLLLVVSPAAAAVRVLDIESKALLGNRTGDPAGQKVAVYLPPGYEENGARYPVLYLLHGIGDSFDVWLEAWNVPAMLDRLIAGGKIEPLIVVMPNGRNRFGGGFYVNSPVTGRWQDYVAEEIVALVDRSFRTRAAPESRAVAGHSMGGYGAIRLGMERADVFGTVFAMSPCCLDAVEDLGAANTGPWNAALAFQSLEEVDAALRKRDFYAATIIGFLMSVFPEREAPMGTRLPFRRERGELVAVEPLYTDFLQTFPMRTIDRSRENLLRLRGLAIDYGYADQFPHIPAASAAFSRELTERRIPHLLDAYRGDHRELVPERLEKVVLPWINSRLER